MTAHVVVVAAAAAARNECVGVESVGEYYGVGAV